MTANDSLAEPQPEQGLGWLVPRTAKVPGAVLSIAMTGAWLLETYRTGSMLSWATSATALRDGRFETLLLHMFAHGGLLHILMNLSVLAAVSGPLVARLGSWWRYAVLYLLSGFAGVALFLLFHPYGAVPMLGASGAISGLLGLLVRLDRTSGTIVPLRSRQVLEAGKDFVKDNLLLILLLTVPALLAGSGGGVAWEAHLGGFLFGLLAAPNLLPSTNPAQPLDQPDEPPEAVTM